MSLDDLSLVDVQFPLPEPVNCQTEHIKTTTVENAYNEVIGSQKMISLYPFFAISVATHSEFNHGETRFIYWQAHPDAMTVEVSKAKC